jgi:hypothetical protein
MLKFVVAVIAAIALCWGVYLMFPQATSTAFHVPAAVDGRHVPVVGGGSVTWMMLCGGVFVLAMWRIVKGK